MRLPLPEGAVKPTRSIEYCTEVQARAERKAAIDAVKLFRKYPQKFAEIVLNVTLWKKQLEIINAVKNNRHVAVKSCHSAGKSFTAATLSSWFSICHPMSRVITTAPTNRQVRKILWKEIPILWRKIERYFEKTTTPLQSRLLQQEVFLHEGWDITGFTAPDYDPNRFQGWHGPHMLVVVDEAAGVTETVYEGINGVVTGPNPHRLDIGNPVDPTSAFARAFKNPNVVKITISAYDTPNFTNAGITEQDMLSGAWRAKLEKNPPPFPFLVDPHWVNAIINEYGTDSPYYQARVLAEFPESAENTVVPFSWIERAQQRDRDMNVTTPHEFGVDIGAGGDPSVIVERFGNYAHVLDTFISSDTMQTAGWIKRHADKNSPSSIKIDVTGVGNGVVGRLKEQGYPVHPMVFGGKAIDSERYKNARSEWIWVVRTLFEDGFIALDPKDQNLAAQLWQYQGKYDSSSRFMLEPKDLMKKRIGRSPDEGDAFLCAFGQPQDEDEEWDPVLY